MYEHAVKYNLSIIVDPKERAEALKKWANTPTDERFTALHFASYHGNMKVIRILLEKINADYNL
jgi:ankyrin repeat protein